MTPDYRALCAELVAAVDLLCGSGYSPRQPVSRLILTVHVEALEELADRARALLAEAEAEGPTDQEIARFLADRYRARMDNQSAFGCPDFDGSKAKAAQIADTREVLARWGRPTPQPVAVSERLPGPVDCTTNPRTGQGQWCWGWVQHDPAPYSGRWRMIRREWLADEATHWLPAIALPTPEATND